ncbi:hypothetical protein ACP26L_02435 [Paenibacillus sp. S-38]
METVRIEEIIRQLGVDEERFAKWQEEMRLTKGTENGESEASDG